MAIDILVVEDEYTERQELTQLLETVTPPEHIRSAATCSAAIAAISQLCPDLILLDIMLRGSSGFEVAEFVRSNRPSCSVQPVPWKARLICDMTSRSVPSRRIPTTVMLGSRLGIGGSGDEMPQAR